MTTKLKIRKPKAQGDDPEILLYGAIGDDFFGDGVTAKDFAAALREVRSKPFTLRINSAGGSVFEGAAMFNMLRKHKPRVSVAVEGLAASAASLVAMGGDSIEMSEASWLMIHQPWAMTIGNITDHQETIDMLGTINETMIGVYAERSGRPRAEIEQMLADETWMDAEKAIELGFADSVFEGQRIAAAIDDATIERLGFKHVPKPVRDAAQTLDVASSIARMESALARYGLTSAA